MNLRLDHPQLALEAGEFLALDDARGTSVHPREGMLWITEEGGFRDFVIASGEAFLVTRPGRTLVQALVASRLVLREEDLPCPANDPL